MRARRFSLIALVLLLGGCARGGSESEIRGPSDLLILSSTQGLTALNAGTGSVLFNGRAAPALAEIPQLFTASYAETGTTVRAIQAATGREETRFHVDGNLDIRTVSSDGRVVALMPPLTEGASPWIPEPRTFTDVTVASVSNQGMVQHFHLRGNFEPEAFSADHRGLYMISYVPPAAPDSYRVVRLDLHRGTVSPVYGRSKAPPETMTGTRLMQVPSADGTKLFTLYTSQPASYAAGYDSWQANSSHPVAFVHTLSLKNSWAVCVPLPGAFGTGDPRDEALAASPDGSLFVIDTRKRLIAVMDPRKLKVVRTARVDFGSLGVEQTHAAVSPDGRTLLVSTGESVVTIDTQSLRRHRTWNLSGIVDGLGFSSDGKRLFVVGDGEVRTLDPVTGDERRTIRAPGATGLEYVGAVDR